MKLHWTRILTFLTLAAGMMPLRATSPGALPGEGLYGLYFNSNDLSGSPIMRRTDRQIDFAWGAGSPGEGVRTDNYSVRWIGFLEAPVTGNFHALDSERQRRSSLDRQRKSDRKLDRSFADDQPFEGACAHCW